MLKNCPLCAAPGGELIISNEWFRVVYVNDPDYPGFIRLILNSHIKEMTDLAEETAIIIAKAVFALEQVMRRIYCPDKINLASLGNMVPHLHWHIIPRYNNDKHFPNPIWGNITNPNYIPNQQLLSLKSQLFSELLHCSLF